jgi:hypothetical protein
LSTKDLPPIYGRVNDVLDTIALNVPDGRDYMEFLNAIAFYLGACCAYLNNGEDAEDVGGLLGKNIVDVATGLRDRH